MGLIIIGILLLGIYIQVNSSGKRLELLGPMSIANIVILIKAGIGTVLIEFLGKFSLSENDYGQYIVTHEYVRELQVLWLLFICAAPIASKMVSQQNLKSGDRSIMAALKKPEGLEIDRGLFRRIKAMFVIMGIGIVFYYVYGINSGMLDRGLEYENWVGRDKGIIFSLATSVLRLRDIFFVMMPLVMRGSSIWFRVISLCPLLFTILASLMSGGRGDVAYPLMMIVIGLILIREISLRRLLLIGIAAGLVLLLLLPILEAVRDSDSFKESKLSSPIERIIGIKKSLGRVGAGFAYRAPQLGRQLYACSDPFLYVKRNEKRLDSGFGDYSRVLRSALPSALSGGVETFDGPRLAKELIGVEKPGWFPCLSLPGDLYRRGGYVATFLGGLVFWMVVAALKIAWSAVVSRNSMSVFSFLVFLLPATYLRNAPLGTVSEVAWMLGWDLMKYIIVFVIIDRVMRVLQVSLNMNQKREMEK